MASDLLSFAQRIAQGSIKVVDLTATLSQEFPVIVMPPEFGQAAPFRIEEISRYDERGPAWYWNNFSVSEHAGTHFDAPIHWTLPARTCRTTPSTPSTRATSSRRPASSIARRNAPTIPISN